LARSRSRTSPVGVIGEDEGGDVAAVADHPAVEPPRVVALEAPLEPRAAVEADAQPRVGGRARPGRALPRPARPTRSPPHWLGESCSLVCLRSRLIRTTDAGGTAAANEGDTTSPPSEEGTAAPEGRLEPRISERVGEEHHRCALIAVACKQEVRTVAMRLT